MKVVLIEFIDEYSSFCKFLQKNNMIIDDFTIVALELKLQAYLEKIGVRFKTTLDYFSNQSHKDIIIESERVMSHINKNFIFTDANDLSNCYLTELSHHIRFYLNHMFRIIEILDNLQVSNKDIEIFGYKKDHFSSTTMICDEDRFSGVLAESFSLQRGVKYTNFNLADTLMRDDTKKIPSNNFFAKAITRLVIYFLREKKTIIVPRINKGLEGMINVLCEHDNSLNFLRIDYSGHLLPMIIFNVKSFILSLFSLAKHGNRYLVNVAFLGIEEDGRECNNLVRVINLCIGNDVGGLYSYKGIDCFKQLSQKVDTGLKKHMLHMLSQAHSMSYLFGCLINKTVISYYALGIMGIAGELSKKLGIKSLFVSHGVHPIPVDQYHEIELLNLCKGFMLSDYTHMAVSTPVQKKHLEYFKNKQQNIDNGEVMIKTHMFADIINRRRDHVRKNLGISDEDIVLLHATTTKSRCAERYHVLETQDEFLSSLRDLVDIVNSKKNLKLLIRLHPGFYLDDDELRSLLPFSDKFIIHRDRPFEDALLVADIVISYSSTAIDESLMNKIPVILYDKWDRYNHFKVGLFEDSDSFDIFPICYINNKNRLIKGLAYMCDAVKKIKKEDINVDRYSYGKTVEDGLYSFIENALQ